MIQLTPTRFVGGNEIRALRDEFQELHSVRLPALLHPDVMRVMVQRLETGAWIDKNHGKYGKEIILDDPPALHLAHFLSNTHEFLQFIRELSGCTAISHYGGRVYRMVPSLDHYDAWHSDAVKERLVGMSINLGPRPYLGGVFRLREKGCDEILRELPNTVPGDAILFRISPELQHMVSPVEGLEPKTAFAGWFQSGGPDFISSVRTSTMLE